VLPLIGLTSITSADFDCTSVDRDTMKEIIEKQKS
jgi:hypothetical protein